MDLHRRAGRVAAGLLAVAIFTLSTLAAPVAADHSLQHTLEQRQLDLERNQQQLESQRSALRDLEVKAQAAQRLQSESVANLRSAQAESQRTISEVQRFTRLIAAAEAELDAIRAQSRAQRARLNARVRSLYTDGRVTYVEVLFSSTSFTDFLDRFELLQTVVRHDVDLLGQVRETLRQAEARKQDLEANRRQWQRLEELARRQEEDLARRAQEVEQYRGQVEYSKEQVQQALEALENQSARLETDIQDLEEAIARELGGLVLSHPVTPVVITDSFGMRLHPILGDYRPHWGVDFAANYSQPVRAAATGTVIISGWQGAFGNAVVISHGKLGGNSISTLYAHNTRLAVSIGAQVERGQVIAYAGSTGWSTGPHVHLEVRVNGKPVDPMEWLGR